MKLRKDVDCGRFLQAVQSCAGDVWFRTSEGDSLNLKSTLSRMVFAVAAGAEPDGGRGEIVCDAGADAELLKDYLLPEE